MRRPPVAAVLLALASTGCAVDQVQRPVLPDEAPLRAVYDTTSRRPYLGRQNILVLTVNVDGALGARTQQSQYLANLRAVLDSAAHYLNVNAAGRVTLAYTYKGPYAISSSICNPNSQVLADNNEALLRAAVAAADPSTDFRTVRQIIVTGRLPNFQACPSGQQGSVRKVWSIPTAEGLLDAAVTFVQTPNPTTDRYLTIHEFTHTIGAAHDFAEVCPANGIRQQVNHQDVACSGGDWLGMDPMSASLKHFSAPDKIKWGWIDPTELVTVSRATMPISGTYTLTLYPQEGPYAPRTPRAMRVMIGSPSLFLHSFVLEFRRDTLPPASFGLPSWGAEPPIRRGVYLHADRSASNSAVSDVVEPFDGTQSQTTYRLRPLTPGVAFRDCTVGVTITVTSVSATSATVRLSYFTPGTVACTEGTAA